MLQTPMSEFSATAARTPGLASRRTVIVLLLLCLVAGVKSLVDLHLKATGQIPYVMTDIDTFWLVGRLYWEGRLTDAYSAVTLFAAQAEMLNTQSFMPYTYPPQYNFVTAALGAVPVALAFAIFVPVTFGLYLFALRGLSATHLGLVIVLVFPAILVNVRTGQNGLLIAGMVALAARSILTNRVGGGFVLGLVAIKPHIAIGIGAAALLTGRWKLAALAIATCGVTLGAAAAVFGTGLFALMFSASAEAMGFLREGAYPLHRMVSVYAFARSFGSSADLSMIMQAVSAVLACAGLLLLALRRADPVLIVAAAVVAPLFISPYAYDYDMTLAGVSLALLAPRIVPRCADWEMVALLILAWVATGWGVPMTLMSEMSAVPAAAQGVTDVPSVQALVNLALVVGIARILRRPIVEGVHA